MLHLDRIRSVTLSPVLRIVINHNPHTRDTRGHFVQTNETLEGRLTSWGLLGTYHPPPFWSSETRHTSSFLYYLTSYIHSFVHGSETASF